VSFKQKWYVRSLPKEVDVGWAWVVFPVTCNSGTLHNTRTPYNLHLSRIQTVAWHN